MSGSIVVAPTRYFAQTDQILGDYFVSGVPNGKYKMTIWHSGKIGLPQTVEVKGDTNKDLHEFSGSLSAYSGCCKRNL